MPAGATYEPLATSAVSGTSTSITFSSIPSTYTDLRVVWTVLSNAAINAYIQFNTVGGTDYSSTLLTGNGTSATSTRTSADYDLRLTASETIGNNLICNYIIDIFSYAGSTNKTLLINYANDKNGSGVVSRQVGLWRSTSAINQISLTTGASMVTGTRATLYGIKNSA